MRIKGESYGCGNERSGAEGIVLWGKILNMIKERKR